jgi:hypothetical protein
MAVRGSAAASAKSSDDSHFGIDRVYRNSADLDSNIPWPGFRFVHRDIDEAHWIFSGKRFVKTNGSHGSGISSYGFERAGTAEKSGINPSSMVGWVNTASRNAV